MFLANTVNQKPLVMGIINITPDSFSDGGLAYDVDAAVAHAKKLAAEGADLLDVGAESSRPGAEPISVEEELRRVMPVLSRLREEVQVPFSIDTYKPEVMYAAVEAGAAMINDVKALQAPGALKAASRLNVPICLMHMQNTPDNMQIAPQYEDVLQSVTDFFASRIQHCIEAGIDTSRLILDPGFCFGKTLEHNIALFRGLPQLVQLGHPLLIGISRKSMIGQILNAPVTDRLYGGIALNVMAFTRGARIFRVHDVKATVDALQVAVAIETGIAA